MPHRLIARPSSTRRKQSGAVLVVSLLLLLVMTLLALGVSHSTQMQERMAGNERDRELALQSAEATLRAAEELLIATHTLATCAAAASTCEAYERGVLPAKIPHGDDTWWTNWGREYDEDLGKIAKTPEFIIEHVSEASDTLSVGSSYLNVVRDFHRTTARSTGMTDSARVVLQTTHSRVSFE